MANKNLTDLTARTATADSDLIHVNSGGTDYKETKANFLSNITSSISSINSSLAKSSVSVTPVSGVTVNANSSILVDGIVILNLRITTSSVFSAGSSLLTCPAPKTTLSGGSGAVAVTTNNTSVAAVVSAQGQLAVSTALAAGTYILSCVYEKA